MTLDEDIVSWHKKTFPDITMGELLLKLEEELRELSDAKWKDGFNLMEESADVYIVSCALYYRFNSKTGLHFLSLLDGLPHEVKTKIVSDKLSKNKKRKWHKVDGVYRHKEGE